MIRLALLIDDDARRVRKRYEDEVEEPERQANAQIATARFELLGSGIAPDATFTLRLAFGVVKGYAVDGADLPYHDDVRRRVRAGREAGAPRAVRAAEALARRPRTSST